MIKKFVGTDERVIRLNKLHNVDAAELTKRIEKNKSNKLAYMKRNRKGEMIK